MDPHGDAVEEILRMIPPERAEDVIYFDPFDEERCNDGNVLVGEPTGCQLGVACTANDSTNILTGFCLCGSDSDCRTGICDPDEGLCVPINQQPSVTIVFGVTSAGVLAEDRQTIFLQTTVVSRMYKR